MPRPAGTQAVDRAAELLVKVVDAQEPIAFSTLASGTGLPKSTVSRLMSALERHGLVNRDPDRGYRPGEVFVGYAQSGRVDRDLVETAQPFLSELGRLTGETVNLGVPAAGMVKQIAQVDSRYLLGGTNWLGMSVPLHCSALGKVLLAFDAASLPIGDLKRRTTATIVDRAVLGRALAEVRRRGYATTDAELEPGLVAIAAPVRITGTVVAAMSVSGPSTRLSPSRIEEVAVVAVSQADALSQALERRDRSDARSREGAA